MNITINTTVTVNLNGKIITSTESVHRFDLYTMDAIKKQIRSVLRKSPDDDHRKLLDDIIKTLNER